MRLILHAGTHKTGTKTLQHFAHAHRDLLERAGLVYPERATDSGDKIWRSHNWIAQALSAVEPDAAREVGEFVERMRTLAGLGRCVLLSAEDLSACCDGLPLWHGLARSDFRTLQRRFLERVRAQLSGFEVEVVLVFRRADEFAHSLYQTLIKGDHFRGDFHAFLGYAAPLFDYTAQLDAFAEAFGEIRTMSYHAFGGEPAQCFLEAAGFAVVAGEVPVRNVSTDARLTWWMASNNRAGRTPKSTVALQKRFAHSKVARRLFEDFGDASFWASEREAEDFHAHATRGFDAIGFPPLRQRRAVGAALDESALRRIEAAYEDWRRRLNER